MEFNKSITLKVNGMHCNGCVNKIKKSMEDLKATQNTEVDISKGEVKVQFNAEKINVSDIKEKIVAVGFQIESITLE